MRRIPRAGYRWLIAIATATLLFYLSWPELHATHQKSYSDLLTLGKAGKIKELDIAGTSGSFTTSDGIRYTVQLPTDTSKLVDTISAEGANVTINNSSSGAQWLLVLLPNLLILVVILVAVLAVYILGRALRGKRAL